MLQRVSQILAMLLAIVLVTGTAHAASFSFNDLQTTVREGSVTSIDELLPLLPTVMKRNPLLVYDSHGLKMKLASPQTPRVILFNEDSSLILAFSRPPTTQNEKAKDTLEVINFNSVSDRFEMRDILLGAKVAAEGFSSVPVNPSVCLSCHGRNPRPLFQDYNAWPGMYGSFSQKGASGAGTKEYNNLAAFLKIQPQMQRYDLLDLSSFKIENGGATYISQDYVARFGAHATQPMTPALPFGQGIERLMTRKLARKLLARQIPTR